MKNTSPIRHSWISWIVIGAGVLSALIGALTTKNYEINALMIIGGLLVIGGIVYHLAMVRCPYCGHSLAGYRPMPTECPCCHKEF